MRKYRGFTLIELMVVVAIIAIIAAFAVPNYLRYGIRARRADGQNMLLRAAMAQESWYGSHNQYGSMTDLGYTASPYLSEKGYYQLGIQKPAVGSSTGYTATATPVSGGPQVKDDCGALTINDTGVKGQAASTTNGTCW